MSDCLTDTDLSCPFVLIEFGRIDSGDMTGIGTQLSSGNASTYECSLSSLLRCLADLGITVTVHETIARRGLSPLRARGRFNRF